MTRPLRRAADNPFRVSRVLGLRYRCDLAALADRFAALGHRSALLGPHGSGKSTLREDLCRHLAARGWTSGGVELHLDEAPPPHHRWRALIAHAGDQRHLTWIDGVEQLPRWRWWWLRRRLTGPLLATAHRPVGLPVLHHHTVDLALLEDLCRDLVGDQVTDALRPRLADLFAATDGNLRDVFRALYDDWAVGSVPQQSVPGVTER